MFKVGTNRSIYRDALYIRKKVFIEEQGVSKAEEIDQYEDKCQYIVGYDDNHSPIATARYRLVNNIVKVERVAVMPAQRGQNIGQLLMQTLENDATAKGYHHFKLGAQLHAVPFYEKLGYHIDGDIFIDAGIPHYHMKKISKIIN
ncbi:GNAT family N-acetyltransferase [Staphylococcus felis]|uniref:GCN5-related N-acetyltransferase n=1 Tax=Staphylococcus felis TaxID=46127 RepID=A0AAX1RU13_9STAP|nr:GNAT family N-acetyltransferase [Staphylococcus felis]REH77977.1 GNAT family N-acetyltransferase [Staphylococcus felis]REH82100.1 GNAT family N-acetyltransferase [Staphylococcus felis]REH82229.1 GNAT family N-acetyltransferase [Staphylococcus felis]REI02919.1 GNAT family N-acetyltransferase [Staphylococcus felis]REI14422.1 GNAT family N-acetyltransferase [Staphylococcus felis]